MDKDLWEKQQLLSLCLFQPQFLPVSAVNTSTGTHTQIGQDPLCHPRAEQCRPLAGSSLLGNNCRGLVMGKGEV